MTMTVMPQTLARAIWPLRRESAKPMALVRGLLFPLVGSLLIAIAAKVQVPFWPVPLTLQTLAIFALALAYGARLGTATVLLYLAEGAVGLPVFAKGGGLAYFTGPTAGYLLGFVVAAFVLGVAANRGWDRRSIKAMAALVLANLIVYAFGAGWLAVQIGVAKAWTAGVLPFLLGDALKIGVIAAALPMAWRVLESIRRATPNPPPAG
ncbi:MAG: biotin transporter BioY [Alphaproteobacteria bacterium]|nr:biotin transporter BioY [Alphaproteobacteria bacterium]